MSNLEQDDDMLTGSLADALTTAVTTAVKDKIELAKSNKTWFDKNVKKNTIRRNFAFERHNIV